MSLVPITSDDLLPNVENHFKVSAGPGAGKTYWLVQHIKNVLHNSNRLGKTRKVACITYTNIAVETILKRLGTSVEHVEVSTIHSFLYKHVVKPYAFLVAQEYGLNVKRMDGHDDIILSNYSFLKEWKAQTGQQRISDDQLIIKAFSSLKWKFDTAGNLVVKTDYPHKFNGYALKATSYFEYKKMAWGAGFVHHDDVLFFSYQIILKHPFVLNVLRAKFPYFFVDEFQDCSPIQIAILKEIGLLETKVGIIGDPAQSIYGFQGAEERQFQAFSLENMQNYVISNNRRSSVEIVDFIKTLRSDITQHSERQVNIAKPSLLVGDRGLCLKHAISECGGELFSLSRDNVTSNAMKVHDGTLALNGKLFHEMGVDTNSDRRRFVSRSVKAIALTREGKYRDALKEMQKEFKNVDEKTDGKSESLNFIIELLSEYDQFKDKPLSNFIETLKRISGRTIPALKNGGAPKQFYESHTYQQLALCVNIPEDMGFHKTIHKSKGDEFNHVLLVLSEETDLNFILNPNLSANEEHRINYVAVSRARDRLFITTPSLGADNRKLLENKLEIVNV